MGNQAPPTRGEAALERIAAALEHLVNLQDPDKRERLEKEREQKRDWHEFMDHKMRLSRELKLIFDTYKRYREQTLRMCFELSEKGLALVNKPYHQVTAVELLAADYNRPCWGNPKTKLRKAATEIEEAYLFDEGYFTLSRRPERSKLNQQKPEQDAGDPPRQEEDEL